MKRLYLFAILIIFSLLLNSCDGGLISHLVDGFPARTDPFDVIEHTTLDNIDSIKLMFHLPRIKNTDTLKSLKYPDYVKVQENIIILLPSKNLLSFERDLQQSLDTIRSLLHYHENSAWAGKNYVFSKIKNSKKRIKYNKDSIAYYWDYGVLIYLSDKYDGLVSFGMADSGCSVSMYRSGKHLYPYRYDEYTVYFYRSLLEESLAKFIVKALKYKNKQIDSLNTIMSIDEAKIEKYDIKRLIPPRYLYLDTLDK